MPKQQQHHRRYTLGVECKSVFIDWIQRILVGYRVGVQLDPEYYKPHASFLIHNLEDWLLVIQQLSPLRCEDNNSHFSIISCSGCIDEVK